MIDLSPKKVAALKILSLTSVTFFSLQMSMSVGVVSDDVENFE